VTTALAGGYATELAALRDRRREHASTADPASPTAVSEALTLRHREVMLTGGRPADLLELAADADAALARFPTWPDLRLLRGGLALAVHRPDLARAQLAAVPDVIDQPPGRVLAADIAVFDGDYRAARAGYERAAREDPQWDTSARLAALAVATGDAAEADALYVEAEDDLTVKQLRAFAWVRVQRGDLARALGDLDGAEHLYAGADRAFPGWWYVAAHRAALALAAGRAGEAVDGYRAVLAEVDRPEFREALGTALAAVGRADDAAACHARALAEYTASAGRGEVHYLHHLAAFCADVVPDPPAAVRWAERDAGIRRNGSTLSLLGWCLFRAGRVEEARDAVAEAFALGAGDPVLRSRARQIGKHVAADVPEREESRP
jgi:tetratricopeptide (TPR) repeat protein